MVNIKSDFEMIVHKLPTNLDYINLYSFGDVHIGSAECNLKLLQKRIDMVLNDDRGYCVLCGDMIDNGLKNSKTNVYQETMSPLEQKETFYKIFKPLADAGKILAGVPGNHCERSVKECGINPMYDVFCRLQSEDNYRENMAIVKISLGQRKNKQRQIAYAGLVVHGASNNKHHKFVMGFDGIDFAVSGHTHTPSYTPRGKLRIDMHNETVRKVGYKEIVVDSGLNTGGYAIKNEYEISAPPETQILKLYGDYKRVDYMSISEC